MSRRLDTGVAGISVQYHEKALGNFILTIEVDPIVKVNANYQLAAKNPDIAAEMVLEHCQEHKPNYLILSYLLGLMIPFLEQQARSR